MAPASGSGFMSASVTSNPRHAHQAAISPPMAPAPMTWMRWPAHLPSVSDFSFSRSPNTRIRFCAVAPATSWEKDAISAFCMA